MLRLFSTQGFHELWKCSYFVSSCVTKRKVRSFLPDSSACHRLHLLSRHFKTGVSVWKNDLEPKTDASEESQTIDLDKWKYVMRSQAASEEKKQVINEDQASDDDDENLKKPGDDLKESSLLEATRDLVSMWREAGNFVPQEMSDEQVLELAKLTTKSAKKKYLKYLAIREGHRRKHKAKQQEKKQKREISMQQNRGQDNDAEQGDDQRGRGPELKSSYLLQFWSRSLDRVLAWKSAQAMMFGQPLVFDMSYESNMSRWEMQNTVSQLMAVEGWNRRATDPYHLHFCNLQPDGAYKQELLKRYGAESWDRLLITSTDLQHVDMFPSEQLVYLTADSRNVLRKFDHSKVYIIGALVDRSVQSCLSLANAKRLKLATARLPLDEYLQWDSGAKNLTLDQMICIMITLKETGNWEEALKFVPQRKHDGFHQHQRQKEITKNTVRQLTNRGPREDGDSWLRHDKRTFKNESQSLYRSHKKSKFTARDRMDGLPSDRENKPIRVRTSFKNSMEGRKGAGKSMMGWWDDKSS